MCKTDENDVEMRNEAAKRKARQHIVQAFIHQVIKKAEVEVNPSPLELEIDGYNGIRIIMKDRLDFIKKKKKVLMPVFLPDRSEIDK